MPVKSSEQQTDTNEKQQAALPAMKSAFNPSEQAMNPVNPDVQASTRKNMD